MFDFGMFRDALQSGIVESTDFAEKFFHCFWWGLQNLSSFGQNLNTSRYVWENCFAVFITISGLVLFISLIGNMQIYLQSKTIRLEEMRLKGQDIEQWMSFQLLSENLQKQVRSYQQYKWQKTRGVDIDNLLRDLPRDLRMNIKRELCSDLIRRVPMFETMDGALLDAMCDRLKPVFYTEDSYIILEGQPIDEMLFIMRGELLSCGTIGFVHSLKAGDCCGKELLTWALDPHQLSNLPISTRAVRALVKVEAFALMAEDLKLIACQFCQFQDLRSEQSLHNVRFHSQQWRTWAACFIQGTWRRYYTRKLEESLRRRENMLQPVSSSSLGATIYASRFAVNTLRGLRRIGARKERLPERMPPASKATTGGA